MADDRLPTVDQAAEVLGVTRNQLYKLVVAKQVKHLRVGKHFRFRLSDLRGH